MDFTQPTAVLEADLQRLMRAAAEAEQRREALERSSAAETRRLLLGIIEAVDAFERVFGSIAARPDEVTPQMRKWTANFRTVRKLLERALEEHGVAPIASVDGEFDPRFHMVGETRDGSGEPDGAILGELRRGYLWRGQVLRKAEVAVAKGAE